MPLGVGGYSDVEKRATSTLVQPSYPWDRDVPRYKFRLFLADGSDVGVFTTAAHDWKPGDIFYDAEHRQWRIVSITPAEGELYKVLFVVEPHCKVASYLAQTA